MRLLRQEIMQNGRQQFVAKRKPSSAAPWQDKNGTNPSGTAIITRRRQRVVGRYTLNATNRGTETRIKPKTLGQRGERTNGEAAHECSSVNVSLRNRGDIVARYRRQVLMQLKVYLVAERVHRT